MKRIAINGMGRTGRVTLRTHLAAPHEAAEIVAVNDVMPIENLVYLLKYDSVHGRLPSSISSEGNDLLIGDRRIRYCHEADPHQLPWEELAIDSVIESTGRFTHREDAAIHLSRGARRVLVGAPSPDADFTLVLGVNHEQFDPSRHHVVSNASCTTNSLAPPLKVLNDVFGLESVMVTTVHAYTASQSTVDRPATAMNRGRAAALSMIPTTTGADKAVVQVMPELDGKLRALAIRVPVPDGSLSDICAVLQKDVTADQLNGALRDASKGPLDGILGYTEDDLVSVDICGQPYSGIVHARATQVSGRMVKILVWYDNEAGYANRCLDVVTQLDF